MRIAVIIFTLMVFSPNAFANCTNKRLWPRRLQQRTANWGNSNTGYAWHSERQYGVNTTRTRPRSALRRVVPGT